MDTQDACGHAGCLWSRRTPVVTQDALPLSVVDGYVDSARVLHVGRRVADADRLVGVR